MQRSIKTLDLKVGMFIHIPLPWYRHPFLKSSFRISSDRQIKKIAANGIHIVEFKDKEIKNVQSEKKVRKPEIVIEAEQAEDQSGTLNRSIITEFKDVVRDKNIPASQKSKLVYKASIQLMSSLLKSPTAENISDFKDVTSNIVDLILSDNETSNYLLGITAHDFYTYTHSVNVGVLSILLSKSLFGGSDKHDMHELGAGFFLHDIGKVRVDPALINKPGRFTEEDMGKMRVHPREGYSILAEAEQLSEESKIIVMQHHERADGSGYPNKLKGNDIHLYGRICSIADVFDALTSRRAYKKSLSPFNALKIMREEMINHFQPELFKKFILLYK